MGYDLFRYAIVPKEAAYEISFQFRQDPRYYTVELPLMGGDGDCYYHMGKQAVRVYGREKDRLRLVAWRIAMQKMPVTPPILKPYPTVPD